jgi:peptidoglycan/LPS O-acetylase OafA/YrhL
LPPFIGNKLEQLGIATYGVYLLHPIVMDITRSMLQILGIQSSYIRILVAISSTIALAMLVFNVVEARLIDLGKRVTRGRHHAG